MPEIPTRSVNGHDEARSDPPHLPLPNLPTRRFAVVAAVDATDDDSLRLKSLGICTGRRVELVQSGDPMIVRVVGSRVGISRRLAERVLVRPA